jgi:hypothetical protein
MLTHVMVALEGIVTDFTYWDYAKSPDDFIYLLHDMTQVDYNPHIIRSLKSNKNKAKCILARDIAGIDKRPLLSKRTLNKLDDVEFEVANLSPCSLDISPNHLKVEELWDNFKDSDTDVYDIIGALFRNKTVLHSMDKNKAIHLCRFMYKYADISQPIEFAMSKLIGVYWKAVIYHLNGEHPFALHV